MFFSERASLDDCWDMSAARVRYGGCLDNEVCPGLVNRAMTAAMAAIDVLTAHG